MFGETLDNFEHSTWLIHEGRSYTEANIVSKRDNSSFSTEEAKSVVIACSIQSLQPNVTCPLSVIHNRLCVSYLKLHFEDSS
jgi:hypothetical protein